jgi:hypothetical protein
MLGADNLMIGKDKGSFQMTIFMSNMKKWYCGNNAGDGLMVNDADARRPASPRRCLQPTFTGV